MADAAESPVFPHNQVRLATPFSYKRRDTGSMPLGISFPISGPIMTTDPDNEFAKLFPGACCTQGDGQPEHDALGFLEECSRCQSTIANRTCLNSMFDIPAMDFVYSKDEGPPAELLARMERLKTHAWT